MKLSDDPNNMEVEVNTKCKSKHGSVKYTKQDSDSKTLYLLNVEVSTKCKSKHSSVKYTKKDSDSETEYIILT